MAPDQLRAVQAIVDQLARQAELRRGFQIPGQKVPLDALPAPVRAACQFYNDALMLAGDGCIGGGWAYLLPPGTGGVYLVVGYNGESGIGSFEIYSPAAQLLAAGVFLSAVAGWTDLDTARQFIISDELPEGVLVPPATLEWVRYDPTACLSVGGRFFIIPDFSRGGPPASRLEDCQTNRTYQCASVAEAQALAAELHAGA